MRRVLLVLCLALLGACASAWRKPEVDVVGVQLVGGSPLAPRFVLTLLVRNPNDRELVLDSLRFEMVSGERRFASGMSASAATIPALGEGAVELEATSRLPELLAGLPDMLDDSGFLRYRLRGEAVISGYGVIPFDRPAKLDVERLLRRKGKI